MCVFDGPSRHRVPVRSEIKPKLTRAEILNLDESESDLVRRLSVTVHLNVTVCAECRPVFQMTQRPIADARDAIEHPVVSLYNSWAIDGRHCVMEATHSAGFEEMWEHVAAHHLPQGRLFTAIDGGCGNGWAARRMSEHARCGAVDAVDAAAVMIDRARDLSRQFNKVRCHVGDIMAWQPEEAVDVVSLCETLYLLDDPAAALAHVVSWLKPVRLRLRLLVWPRLWLCASSGSALAP